MSLIKSVFEIGILKDLDATAIAENIKNKEFTPQEVLDCVRERATKANPKLNAIVSERYELGKYDKNAVFSGVPMFIKDLIKVKGFPCRMGSTAVSNVNIKKSDKVIGQILSTGCYTIGKSSTSEFGLLPTTETIVNGDTRNPHNLDYSTGGSSGGAGALVSAGVVPIAHTMDGGGSTRIPASCCGLIGLKPTRGRHLNSPTKKLPIDITTSGIVSRSVRDTANYYHAIDKYNKRSKLAPINLILGPSKRRLKIALFTQSPVGIESHPDVNEVILHAGKVCENLGHQVEYISNPYNDKVGMDFLAYYSLLAWLNNTFGKLTFGMDFDKSKTELFTQELASYRKRLKNLSPGAIKRLNSLLISEYDSLLSKYDLLLSPTLAAPVPKLGYFGTQVPITSAIMRLNSYVNFTIVQNTTGAPAISLPMGKCKNGLPIGAMFAGKNGGENRLLELAFEIEQAGAFVF